MGSVPGVPFTPAGQLVSSGQLQATEVALKFLLNPPRCSVYNTTGQSIPASTNSVLSFGGEDWDTDGMHSTTSNPSRLTIQTPGLYLFTANVGLPSGAGACTTEIRKNGGYVHGGSNVAQSASSYAGGAFVSVAAQASAGDYFEVYIITTAATTTNTGLLNGTNFQAQWIAAS